MVEEVGDFVGAPVVLLCVAVFGVFAALVEIACDVPMKDIDEKKDDKNGTTERVNKDHLLVMKKVKYSWVQGLRFVDYLIRIIIKKT